jgi:hypothetical protein
VQLEGVRRSRWKWLEAFTFEPGPEGAARRRTVRQELYDLQTDPGELRDLSAAPPVTAPLGELRADLARVFAADAGLHGEALELQAARERLEAEAPGDVQLLRALGYR